MKSYRSLFCLFCLCDQLISHSHCVKDEELVEMHHSAEQMEQQYGHLVDRVMVKEDSVSACVDLRNILERLEREPQWVPVIWVRP